MTVVADTSVILNLCFIGQQDLLTPLFGSVLVPRQVVEEFERLASTDPRFRGLVFPNLIQSADETGTAPILANATALHRGEIAALSLALHRRADLVLMDEREGRAAASALGLVTMGLLGILVQARRRSLIPAVAPFLDLLQNGARFWIAPALREMILRSVHE